MFNVYSECDLKSRPEENEYNTKKHTAPTELLTYRHYVAINLSPLRGFKLNTKRLDKLYKLYKLYELINH